MTVNRLPDFLDHMRQAIADALAFTEGMAQPDFELDKLIPSFQSEPGSEF
jgi:uncharacterized protein with HEPN domain